MNFFFSIKILIRLIFVLIATKTPLLHPFERVLEYKYSRIPCEELKKRGDDRFFNHYNKRYFKDQLCCTVFVDGEGPQGPIDSAICAAELKTSYAWKSGQGDSETFCAEGDPKNEGSTRPLGKSYCDYETYIRDEMANYWEKDPQTGDCYEKAVNGQVVGRYPAEFCLSQLTPQSHYILLPNGDCAHYKLPLKKRNDKEKQTPKKGLFKRVANYFKTKRAKKIKKEQGDEKKGVQEIREKEKDPYLSLSDFMNSNASYFIGLAPPKICLENIQKKIKRGDQFRYRFNEKGVCQAYLASEAKEVNFMAFKYAMAFSHIPNKVCLEKGQARKKYDWGLKGDCFLYSDAQRPGEETKKPHWVKIQKVDWNHCRKNSKFFVSWEKGQCYEWTKNAKGESLRLGLLNPIFCPDREMKGRVCDDHLFHPKSSQMDSLKDDVLAIIDEDGLKSIRKAKREFHLLTSLQLYLAKKREGPQKDPFSAEDISAGKKPKEMISSFIANELFDLMEKGETFSQKKKKKIEKYSEEEWRKKLQKYIGRFAKDLGLKSLNSFDLKLSGLKLTAKADSKKKVMAQDLFADYLTKIAKKKMTKKEARNWALETISNYMLYLGGDQDDDLDGQKVIKAFESFHRLLKLVETRYKSSPLKIQNLASGLKEEMKKQKILVIALKNDIAQVIANEEKRSSLKCKNSLMDLMGAKFTAPGIDTELDRENQVKIVDSIYKVFIEKLLESKKEVPALKMAFKEMEKLMENHRGSNIVLREDVYKAFDHFKSCLYSDYVFYGDTWVLRAKKYAENELEGLKERGKVLGKNIIKALGASLLL